MVFLRRGVGRRWCVGRIGKESAALFSASQFGAEVIVIRVGTVLKALERAEEGKLLWERGRRHGRGGVEVAFVGRAEFCTFSWVPRDPKALKSRKEAEMVWRFWCLDGGYIRLNRVVQCWTLAACHLKIGLKLRALAASVRGPIRWRANDSQAAEGPTQQFRHGIRGNSVLDQNSSHPPGHRHRSFAGFVVASNLCSRVVYDTYSGDIHSSSARHRLGGRFE